MQLHMLKAKLHRATVTETNLDYHGSITIDEELLEASGILPSEKVEIANVRNGARFATYALVGKRGSGVIGINGAAARLCAKGDKIIVLCFAVMDEKEARALKPKVLVLDEHNKVAERV
jgi:aspartate 1-decarboxylase